ncbi:MAG TPA: glycosyltransferase family 2 protein [Candidatus Binatia bacterium]|nr:glycosyltransferase family 2 protein [Candidatus Binatia bacterium]
MMPDGDRVRLSVLTPVFNGRRFIADCIDNVLAQQAAGVEHIVLDACSTDGTADIARTLAGRHPHLRVVSEPDRGQSDALNKGIALARGSVLGVLNVDDYYEPGTLPEVLQRFESMAEPSLLVGDCNVWNGDGTLSFVAAPNAMSFRALLTDPNPSNFPVNPAAYFYHRSLHGRVGGYDVSEDLGMDLDFLLRAYRVAGLHYVPKVFGNFRLWEGTKTFEAMRSGVTQGRVREILARHRRALPWHERVHLRLSESLARRWRARAAR